MPGFEEAGGLSGPGYDFDRESGGELRVATAYMRRAGYRGGRYDGPPLLAVAGEASPASNTAQLIVEQLAQLGIRLNFRELTRTTMFTKFCGVPRAAVAICPSMMWAKDFFDSQSMLDPVFNGANIVPSGNVNTAEVNDPTVNAELERAAALTDPAARARAYGELDRRLTAQAYVIPWVWNNAIIAESTNVRGVYSRFSTEWDLAWSGLR
jgi:peptide/nickel transport system substrate-binding protein